MRKQLTASERRAHAELKKVKRRFKPKRETVLIRVQEKWHAPLKAKAKEKKKTLSKLHDEIYPNYFKQQL